jgi:electron transfer flavoprotein beta subunit
VNLRIVVCLKHVPDATGDRYFADDLTVARDTTGALLPELDEYAVEQALRIAEQAGDAEVTVLTAGRRALRMRSARRCR